MLIRVIFGALFYCYFVTKLINEGIYLFRLPLENFYDTLKLWRMVLLLSSYLGVCMCMLTLCMCIRLAQFFYKFNYFSIQLSESQSEPSKLDHKNCFYSYKHFGISLYKLYFFLKEHTTGIFIIWINLNFRKFPDHLSTAPILWIPRKLSIVYHNNPRISLDDDYQL